MKKRFYTFLLMLCFIFPIGATFWGCSFGAEEPKTSFSYEVEGNDHIIYY